jgi:hypothetical protein
MNAITEAGAYRFEVLEHVVNLTKNSGFPQLVVKARAVEQYNEETEEWDATYTAGDGNEYAIADADMQTTAFLVLANAEKPLLNWEQAVAAFGWSGKSFAELNDMDLAGKRFLGQVRPNEYNGQTTLRIEYIDHVDGEPVRTLKALDASGLKDLDAKFGGMAPAGGGKAPAKAPAKAPPKAAPKAPPAAPAPTETDVPGDGDQSGSEGAPATPPTPPAPPAESKSKPKGKGKGKGKSKPEAPASTNYLDGVADKDTAWSTICKFKAANCTDAHLNDTWVATCLEVAGDDDGYIDEATVTADQWKQIAEKVLDTIPSQKF